MQVVYFARGPWDTPLDYAEVAVALGRGLVDPQVHLKLLPTAGASQRIGLYKGMYL
jgi:hypothetical protein